MRWKILSEMSTDDKHKVYSSGEKDRHDGFLVHRDIVSSVLGCRSVSSRLISIRLISVSHHTGLCTTFSHDDNEVEQFYQQLEEIIDQTTKKDILIVQGDWNAKVGKGAQSGRLGKHLWTLLQ